MLRNFWYAVEFSDRVGRDKPARVKVLGVDLVLWRVASGAVAAARDVCSHRGAALSLGTCKDGRVVCPYHGWRFDEHGVCDAVPSDREARRIPGRTRIDAYPTEERYGLVWVFLGDLPEAERPPIPPFPEYGAPGWRAVTGDFTWRAHYTRVVENAVDIAHAPFVHAGSFGNPDKPWVEPYEVVQEEWSVGAEVDLEAPAPSGFWGLFMPKERPPVHTGVKVYLPNISRLDLTIPIGRIVIFSTNVPVDEHTTITKWTMLRTFFTGAWADGDSRKRTLAIFLEDQDTVESQRPHRVPDAIGDEAHVKADAIQVALRRLRAKVLARGWGVDPRPAADPDAGPFTVKGPSEGSVLTPLPTFPPVPDEG